MHRGAISEPLNKFGHLAPHTRRTAEAVLVIVGMVGSVLFLVGRTLPRAWDSLQTDFPNYYSVAHLVREGYDTSRIYDWTWIQRQKDRLGIDQPIVGTTALTPFSFLTALPLAYFEPLTAKHIWTIANLLFAAISAIFLKRISEMRWLWIALLFLFCWPLHTNIVLGQMYLLLLCTLSIALWAHLHGHRLLAGILVGIAAGWKVFPLLFVFYFLRKRDWRAVTGVVVALIAVLAISLAVFGTGVLSEYFSRQLIWASRGEALDPYNLQSASISSLLHRLFIFEPELNPSPLLSLPWLLPIMLPLFQVLLFGPILLLSSAGDSRPRTLKLEWASLTLAILAISTLPASYHFTVALLPIVLMVEICLSEGRTRLAFTVAALFLIVGIAGSHQWDGAAALLGVPRLYALIALWVCGIALLGGVRKIRPGAQTIGWAALLACGCIMLAIAGFRHQRKMFQDFSWRLPIRSSSYLFLSPAADPLSGSLQFIAMTDSGYEYATWPPSRRHSGDELTFSSAPGALALERTTRSSRVDWVKPTGVGSIPNAHTPAIAPDTTTIAFVRDDMGKGQLWLQSLHDPAEGRLVTPKAMNVLEAAIAPDGAVIFSAQNKGMMLRAPSGDITHLSSNIDRYPAVSPDGQWLAFSRLENGVWNLWLTNLHNQQTRRISDVDCDQITPSWQNSETLLYATDCGRGLMLTALARRNIKGFLRP